MKCNDTRKQFDEAMQLFHDYYLSMAETDPNAAIRIKECIRLLGTGTVQEICDAYARHFENRSDGMRDEAEHILRDSTAQTPFGMRR